MMSHHTQFHRRPERHDGALRAARQAARLGALGLLTITLLASAVREASPLQPPVGAPPSRAEPGPQRINTARLRLRNASADTLRVEIRIGAGQACVNARSTDARVLPPGRAWVTAANQPICWRQSLAGAAPTTVRWTPWERRALQPAQRAEAALTPR